MSLGKIAPMGDRNNCANLFFVHAVDGGIETYRDLANALARDVNAYGISAFDFEGRTPFPATINDAAVAYANGIQELQPVGPYFLAGWSLGGHIAFETARELSRRQERVEMLLVIDSHAAPAHSKVNLSAADQRALLGESRELRAKLARVRLWRRFLILYFRIASPRLPLRFWIYSDEERCRFLLDNSSNTEIFSPDNALRAAKTPDEVLYMFDLVNQQFNAGWHWDENSYPAPIHYVKSISRNMPELCAAIEESTLAFWRTLTSDRLEVSWIEGRHDAALHEPGVHAVAAQIRESVSQWPK